jgi:hypothetical protein
LTKGSTLGLGKLPNSDPALDYSLKVLVDTLTLDLQTGKMSAISSMQGDMFDAGLNARLNFEQKSTFFGYCKILGRSGGIKEPRK